MFDDDRDVFKKIVMGYENWCFMYDTETKHQSTSWTFGLNIIINYENMFCIHLAITMPVSVATFYEEFNCPLEVCFRHKKTRSGKENIVLPM